MDLKKIVLREIRTSENCNNKRKATFIPDSVCPIAVKYRRLKFEGPKFFTANIRAIWELYVLDLKTKFFLGKKPRYIFQWKQCRNSAYSLTGNTPNASKNVSPICLLKPKSFGFLKISPGVRSPLVRCSTIIYTMRTNLLN